MDIQSILAPERVQCDLDCQSKKRVLEKIGALIASSEKSISDLDVFQSMVERERLGSTGLGHGVAIPHGRLKTSSESIGAFIKLKTPIPYDAIDKAPVDLLFALSLPEKCQDTHLHLLSLVAQMFNDQAFCAKIRAAQNDAELYEALMAWKPYRVP